MKLESLTKRAKVYKQMIWSGRKLLVTCAFFGLMLFGIHALVQNDMHTASTTFHPDQTKGGGLGSLADPLSLVFGGGSKKLTAQETNQMIGVLISRHLSELVSKDTVEKEGQPYMLADLILGHKTFSLHPLALLNKFIRLFQSNDPLTEQEKVIYAGNIIRKRLNVETNDNDFVVMKFSFADAYLTQKISETYIQKLENYYISQQTEKARKDLEFYSNRADSVEHVIDSISRRLATYMDRSAFGVTAQVQRRTTEYEMRIEYLSEMYKTLIISREQAVTALQQRTPVIQVLDRPLPPFEVSGASPLIYGLLGAILFGIGAIAYLVRTPLKEDLLELIRESLENPSS